MADCQPVIWVISPVALANNYYIDAFRKYKIKFKNLSVKSYSNSYSHFHKTGSQKLESRHTPLKPKTVGRKITPETAEETLRRTRLKY